MDTVTHTLTAVALSHAGLNRRTRFATFTLAVGANLPEVDIVAWVGGTATYLQYHRGFTHTLLGVTVLGFLLGAAVYYWGRRARPKKSAPPASLPWLLAAAWLGTASHLLLDFTNAYGVRPFLPFSGRWYAWDIMFIVDPVLLALLVTGLGLPALLRLISEEVGAGKPSYRAGAILALCATVLLWGVRDIAHRRVVTMLDSHTYRQEIPRRIGAFPSPANPFEWTGVVETDSAFHVLAANAFANDVDVDQARVFGKAELTPPLATAMKTRAASIFLDFARFPWSQSTETTAGYAVGLRDLRFFSPTGNRRAFFVDVDLDNELRVRAESCRFATTPGMEERQRPPEEEERAVSP